MVAEQQKSEGIEAAASGSTVKPPHVSLAEQILAELPGSEPTMVDILRADLMVVQRMIVPEARQEEFVERLRNFVSVERECIRREIRPAFDSGRQAFMLFVAELQGGGDDEHE